MTDLTNLADYPPGMTANQVHEAAGLTEHSRRQAEADGLLAPVEIGRKKIYPRHQVFALLGMVDPDVAAADAAREVSGLRQTEAPSVVDDAPDNLVPLDPPRSEVAS